MANTLFNDFLDQGLFEIEDNDQRYEQLLSAVAQLVQALEATPKKTRCFTLVALDDNISETDPILLETEGIVKSHWKTLRTRHRDMPRTILRAVIFCALDEVGKKNATLGRVIFYTGTNLYPFVHLKREKELVDRIFNELGEKAEKLAYEKWSLVEKIPEVKINDFKLTNFKLGTGKVESVALKEALKIAAARTPQGHDPYNHPVQWSEYFAENATTGIVTAVQNALSSFEQSLSPASLETPINAFFTELKKTLTQTLSASFNSMVAIERRSKLLWWKETLYSTSLNKSYRDLSDAILPVVMAYDLYMLLPAVVPVSVDYLLRDTYLLVKNGIDESETFENLLTVLSEQREIISPLSQTFESCEGRICFAEFLGDLMSDTTRVELLPHKTGIDLKAEIKGSELAVMILHDFMANHLLSK